MYDMEQEVRGGTLRGWPPRPPGLQGRPRAAEATYVLAVAGVATYGFVKGDTAAIVGAVALSMPTGLPAIIGYYFIYGVLGEVPGADPSTSSGSGSCTADGHCHETTSGDLAPWFVHTTTVIGILAVTVAAVVNVLLLRILLARRRTPPGTTSASGSTVH